MWSRDGSELFYVDPTDTLLAVDVSTAGEFTINEVARLFHQAFLRTAAGGSMSYDVSLDGQRFLVTEPADGEAAAANSSIRFVLNWPAKYLPQH